MKSIQFLSTLVFVLLSTFSFAQSKASKETVKVYGNCNMCKKNIEKAAKSAGASTASWDADTKMLTLSYPKALGNSDKIQQAIAAAGYDTEKFTADQKAYLSLDECCQYDRKEGAVKAAEVKDCCKDGACKDETCKDNCCKDGKCKDGASCSKDGQKCQDQSCCKSASCCSKS
jgi:hypothetical protein